MTSWFHCFENYVVINLKVQPKARQHAFLETLGEYKKIAIKAPPQEGEANAALIKFLAKYFKLTQQEVEIITGHQCRLKRIRLPLTAIVKARLEALDGAGDGNRTHAISLGS